MIGIKGAHRRGWTFAVIGTAAVVALSWTYLWMGAGMGMSALDMTALALFPHLQAENGGSMDPSLPATIIMWWVMMIAMMTPSAAPLILLYRRVLRHHDAAQAEKALPTTFLLTGYLTAWLAFSIGAGTLQKALQPTGLISEMMLWSKSATLSATVLAAAGIYQLSPLKRACLAQCRSPAHFLTEHWRPGYSGSFRLGVRHGAYCVGCCWLLMAVLFVVGIMNLIWIAALSLIVLAEKILPAGERFGTMLGIALIAWAVATLLV